uniref:Putative TonB-like protein n=1 Tax=mine drainage metagenome TaxID=410659 RepID=E6PZM0_9ZZZZ
MQTYPDVPQMRLGLLPEPERNPVTFVASAVLNIALLALLLILGTLAHHVIEQRRMESTLLELPVSKPPEIKVKTPPAPKIPPPPLPQTVKLEPPRINVPREEIKPDIKPLPVMKETAALPNMPVAKPQIVLAPQPKAALAMAAAPAITPQARPSTAAVHFGDMNGAKPNPNANRPATVAALGNPFGGNQGAATTPRGVVGSTGFGNGTKSGSNAGSMGHVASAGIPGGSTQTAGFTGKVASAGIPGVVKPAAPAMAVQEVKTTPPVLINSNKPEYTSEARQLKIQGDVVLRVTITTTGQIIVRNIVHGLGHGLDESAIHSASTYRFQPATRNGQPVEYTTNIIIKFQTA